MALRLAGKVPVNLNFTIVPEALKAASARPYVSGAVPESAMQNDPQCCFADLMN